jgi:hypothetical protein
VRIAVILLGRLRIKCTIETVERPNLISLGASVGGQSGNVKKETAVENNGASDPRSPREKTTAVAVIRPARNSPSAPTSNFSLVRVKLKSAIFEHIRRGR